MINSIVQQLINVDFRVLDKPNLPDIPQDLTPSLITQEGDLFVLLTTDQPLLDSLLEAIGKTSALRQYLVQQGLNQKYSVALVLTAAQFRQFTKEIRQVLPQEVPLLILG